MHTLQAGAAAVVESPIPMGWQPNAAENPHSGHYAPSIFILTGIMYRTRPACRLTAALADRPYSSIRAANEPSEYSTNVSEMHIKRQTSFALCIDKNRWLCVTF